MQNINLSFEQIRIYIIVINIVLGILFGIFPLLSGIKMNNRKYGVYGFVGATIGGAILGIFLSFPVAIIFTWLILKNAPAKDSVNAAVNEVPVETYADNTENR